MKENERKLIERLQKKPSRTKYWVGGLVVALLFFSAFLFLGFHFSSKAEDTPTYHVEPVKEIKMEAPKHESSNAGSNVSGYGVLEVGNLVTLFLPVVIVVVVISIFLNVFRRGFL